MRSIPSRSRNGGDDMAVPVAAIAKAAATVLSNEKTRKAIGWVIAAILSPVILLIVLICSLASGTADHNNTAVDLTFHGGSISAQAQRSTGNTSKICGAASEAWKLQCGQSRR